MLKRTITTFAIIFVTIPICLLSHTWIYPIAFSIFALVGTYEMLGCVGTRRYWYISVPACLLAAASPLLCRLIQPQSVFVTVFASAMLLFMSYLLTVGVFSRGKLDAGEVFSSFAPLFYVIASFTAMVLLVDRPFGFYFLVIALYGPWISDVFAYLCGRFFGKHKLIPEVSPKKTVEGMVGGILFSVFFALVYGVVLTIFIDKIHSVSYFGLALAGAVVSAVSQVGDLIMSYIKRKYGVKDYGNCLPGHGGILDRFDSVLGVAPYMLLLTMFQEQLQFFA